eukprot:CAMPEP_0173297730 /NCGR_PEP_ID=MMETSP1143-20121109/15699_1 /TAXON_ID=483371 /ORGANISM="non described non described, Strain CCMP2298" /LENGTH=209 /DNA_ID=CAMNT_0014237767 /DNA_START=346 /DNA_END=976 /DNA_ORIENTATION=-
MSDLAADLDDLADLALLLERQRPFKDLWGVSGECGEFFGESELAFFSLLALPEGPDPLERLECEPLLLLLLLLEPLLLSLSLPLLSLPLCFSLFLSLWASPAFTVITLLRPYHLFYKLRPSFGLLYTHKGVPKQHAGGGPLGRIFDQAGGYEVFELGGEVAFQEGRWVPGNQQSGLEGVQLVGKGGAPLDSSMAVMPALHTSAHPSYLD